MKKRLVAIAVAVVMVLGLALPAAALKPGNQNIAEIATGNGSFTTLVAALSCTSLMPAVTGTSS